MTDTRHKGLNWNIGDRPTWDGAKLAVLMDIRDELKELNSLLHCHNFTDIPHILRGIRRKLSEKKKKKR